MISVRLYCDLELLKFLGLWKGDYSDVADRYNDAALAGLNNDATAH